MRLFSLLRNRSESENGGTKFRLGPILQSEVWVLRERDERTYANERARGPFENTR